MTAKHQTRSKPAPTSNLVDPDELRAFARCPECRKAYFDKNEALEVYLGFFCKCGAFMDMASFSLEFLHRVDRFWKGGKL